MSGGFFGKLFDWNNDGKLDFFERMNEVLWIEHMVKDSQKKKEAKEIKQQTRETHFSYSSPKTDKYAWRVNYGKNIFDMVPEEYESEAEYRRVLNHMYAWQQEWIDALRPEELIASERHDISPKDYPTHIAFRLALDQSLEDDLDTIKYTNIPAEKKKVMLQDTFDLLSDNYGPNRYTLYDLIEEMARLDYSTAVDMSKELIIRFRESLRKFGSLGSDIICALYKVVGDEKVFRTVVDDEVLRIAIFNESGRIEYKITECIGFFALGGEVELVDELLALVYSNQYRNTDFSEIMLAIAMFCTSKHFPKESVPTMLKWSDRIVDCGEKAKINSIFLNCINGQSIKTAGI